MSEQKKKIGKTVFYGGDIITCDQEASIVEAIAIDNGRILAVGNLNEVLSITTDDFQKVDLKGATLMPGLIDTHPHLMHFGAFTHSCTELFDAVDHEEIVARLAERAADTPEDDWVMGTPVGEPHYFVTRSYEDLKEGELPDRKILDQASTKHPIIIQAWAPKTPNVTAFNTRALEILGISAETPDRVGNVWIEKDENGFPTGRLSGTVIHYYSNEPFMNEILSKIPLLNPMSIIPGTLDAMKEFNALGVTAGYDGHAMDFPLIEAYQYLRESDLMSVRMLCCPEAEPYGLPWTSTLSEKEFDGRMEQARDMVSRDDDFLRIDGLTIGRGGPCGPGLTLMREPYLDAYGNMTTGVSFVEEERTQRAMTYCCDHGVRLNIVTAGTGEHDDYLKHLETLDPTKLNANGRAWILQHLYFVEDEQAKRMGTLGFDVTTSMSFSWGKGDMFRERMGEEVLKDLIPLRRLIDSGMHVACGTDWGPKNIFKHIALAVEPSFAVSGCKNDGPAQVVGRQEALNMWTREAAHVLRWEGIGSIEVGNHADLVIIDQNPLTVSLDKLPDTKVHATMLGGNVVYGDDYFDAN